MESNAANLTIDSASTSERSGFVKIPWISRIGYGLADSSCNIVYGMINTLLTLFYTDYVGISFVTVGLVMLISRFFDGSSDVIMGVLVSKTRSRWGRSRPWLLWTALPYVITSVALFTVPQTSESLQFWYMFVTYNLCTTVCYTAINVPLGSLSTMMTRDSHERDLLSTVRMALAPVGRLISVTFTMPVVRLFGNDQAAWVKAMSMWCAIAFVLLIFSFVTCKEHVQIPDKTVQKATGGFKRNFLALVKNPYFWATLILWTITCVHSTLVGTDLPYYCKYIFGNDTWMYSSLYLAENITLIVGAMVCPLLLGKFNKRDLSLAGAILAVVGHLLFLFNPMSYEWAMAVTIIRGIGQAPLTALVFGMMGDVIEYGQWKFHIRQESLVFGGGSLGFKIGTGLTSALISVLLTSAGYLSSTTGGAVQPESAKQMIIAIYKFGPAIIWGIAVVVLILYKLDKIYPKVMADLAEREARGEM
ncbi:glycoside-pentoside-hexuronide (GPH):cation symporter [uncultured Agathobaculum sp.]|uniref:MFS transporter n=1 Tax=uncultured Agathobaculum sp. TaxID=2048140 RepID=UPI003208EC41